MRLKFAAALTVLMMITPVVQARDWVQIAGSDYYIDVDSISLPRPNIFTFDVLNGTVQYGEEYDCAHERMRERLNGMTTPWSNSTGLSKMCQILMKIYRARN